MTKPEILLWLDDNRGIYIPRDFANSFVERDKHVQGVTLKQWDILEEGPGHEQYWDTWNEVLDNAIVTDDEGIKYSVYQDGICWLVPEGMIMNDIGEFIWSNDFNDELDEEIDDIY
jgi:hypothetical protein